jgi:hypothetical protein
MRSWVVETAGDGEPVDEGGVHPADRPVPNRIVSPLPVRRSEVPVRPAVLPILRGRAGRTVGVVVEDREGTRWQPTPDVEGLVRLGIAAAVAVALPIGVAAAVRRPTARVDRLSMGPGGWVSFKGFAAPTGRGERRPWWARLLCAHRAT